MDAEGNEGTGGDADGGCNVSGDAEFVRELGIDREGGVKGGAKDPDVEERVGVVGREDERERAADRGEDPDDAEMLEQAVDDVGHVEIDNEDTDQASDHRREELAKVARRSGNLEPSVATVKVLLLGVVAAGKVGIAVVDQGKAGRAHGLVQKLVYQFLVAVHLRLELRA